MIHRNIWVEMIRNSITTRALASYLGITSIHMKCKLNGKREFTLSEIENIAELFHCSLDYLVGHKVKASNTDCDKKDCSPSEEVPAQLRL